MNAIAQAPSKAGITAKIVLDSVSPKGKRITTLSLRYPRFIHAEAKTHRIISQGNDTYEVLQDIGFMSDTSLSRNAMSSRAVPVKKMIEQVRNDPAMPIHWGANQPGMQANGEVSAEARADAELLWRQAANVAADVAEAMANDLGLHKQVVNRVLEPFQWMYTVVTATEWDNFFLLRRHHMADPNMKALADVMWDAIEASQPMMRDVHIPYFDPSEMALVQDIMEACLVSAARCARVSYLNHDGTNPRIDKDLELATLLRDSKHASPFEHIGFAAGLETRSRNFIGWTQFREVIGL